VTVLFADMKGSMELPVKRPRGGGGKILDPVLALLRYEGTVGDMRRLFSFLLAMIAMFALRLPAAALTMQEAVHRAKPAVVLISVRVEAEVTMNCGQAPVIVHPAPFVETGTGWFVDGRGYLITNGHVVDPAYRLPPWVIFELKKSAIEQGCVVPALRARGLTQGQPALEDQIRREMMDRAMAGLKIITSKSITVVLSNGAKLSAEVQKFSPPISFDTLGQPLRDSGRDLALLHVQPGVYPALGISQRAPQISDPIHMLGFPSVVLYNELLSRSDVVLDASVTNGAVSGFNKDAIGQDVIQTDAPAAHGSSGSPAIGDDANVIGIMTFVSLSSGGGSLVQGFNFLIPAKDVLKFLSDTAVTDPGQSPFNPAWAAGVDAFFDRRYSTALARLREADRLVPDLVDVKHLLREAEEKVKNPPPRPFPWPWVAVGVTLVSLVAYGGTGVKRWRRNRYRVLPVQVVGFMESGQNPVLLDVRTKTDYETSPLKLPRAIRLDPDEVDGGQFHLGVDPMQLVIAYCTSPEEQSSARVVQRLRQRGYRNVRILKGGLGGWTNARLPIETKSHLPSIGLEIYKNLTMGDIERHRFKAGEVVFLQDDDPRGEAYVIHSGAVEIRTKINGADRVLNRLGVGELFGVLALFLKSPRSASAVAVSDTELLIIKNDRLEWLIFNRPQLTMEILKHLSALVVSTDAQRNGGR